MLAATLWQELIYYPQVTASNVQAVRVYLTGRGSRYRRQHYARKDRTFRFKGSNTVLTDNSDLNSEVLISGEDIEKGHVVAYDPETQHSLVWQSQKLQRKLCTCARY